MDHRAYIYKQAHTLLRSKITFTLWGPTKHLLLRPAMKGNLFLGRRGLKNTMSISSHRYINNSEPPVLQFYLAKRTQKCGSQLQENFACTVMQRICSIHTKHIKKSRRNKIKIKKCIIAEAVIGGLFQRSSALKLSNSLQLLRRKLISSQMMSRKNLRVDQIRCKLLWYSRFVRWSCNNHCHGVIFW